jgi:hypothetical protein
MMRPQKITLGKVREMGIRGLRVYCSDYKCSHAVEIKADQWPDHVGAVPVFGAPGPYRAGPTPRVNR